MKLPWTSRMLVAIAAVLLALLYVVPLWRVDLGAPQYPEGLGLEIRINTVAGIKPHDLANINALNHYIGMRPIEPDAIPELRYMPWALAALIVLGLAAAVAGRRRLLIVWLAALVLSGVAGLYDFWRWGYDYGHNLDEAAAIIKVPGMTYSPPVIGTKKLLNFTATSLPAAGAWLAGLAFALGVAGLWLAGRPTVAGRFARRHAGSVASIASVAALAFAMLGCSGRPAPIHYGEDACAWCRMILTDRRFGATLVSSQGRSHQFDSIECLAAFARERDQARSVLVTDFTRPGVMLAIGSATLVRAAVVNSPMGRSLFAVATVEDARRVAGDKAELLAWSDVLSLAGNNESRAGGS